MQPYIHKIRYIYNRKQFNKVLYKQSTMRATLSVAFGECLTKILHLLTKWSLRYFSLQINNHLVLLLYFRKCYRLWKQRFLALMNSANVDEISSFLMGRNLKESSVQFVCSSGSSNFTDFVFANDICWVVPTSETLEAPLYYFVLMHFRWAQWVVKLNGYY